MGDELRDILTKLLEGQNRLETEVSNIKTEVSNIKTEVSNIKTDVRNNSVRLEDIDKKINIIAEVQTAHKEQNGRGFEKVHQDQINTNTLLTSSLKSVSNDVMEVKQDIKELKEKFDKVEKVTMQNTYDVAYLKSVK